jgi:hypothetical protein
MKVCELLMGPTPAIRIALHSDSRLLILVPQRILYPLAGLST